MEIPTSINVFHSDILTKRYSVSEMVREYLNRIEKNDSKINSFLTVCKESAIKTASNLDLYLKEHGKSTFNKYPLFGVCVAHKDLFSTKGIRTTAGSRVLESYVPVYSATAVEMLENAGCITLGKTNLDAWGHGSSGENSDFGPTLNPWNYNLTPGGSSSGSGAAIASNFCMATTGTDTCGSIRLPANFCGCVGLKPTYGVISRYGLIAMASSLDSVGIISHEVKDIKALFLNMIGSDGMDANVTNANYEKKQPLLKKIKMGIPKEFFIKGIDKEVENRILEAVDIFKKNLKIEIKEVSLPHTEYAISTYYIIQPAEVSSNLGRFDGIRYGNKRASFGDEAKRRIMLGTYVLSAGYYDAYYLKAMKVRKLIINEVDSALSEVDVMIAPVSPTPPFKIGEKTNDPVKMYLSDVFAATANLSGIPSIAIPFGFSKKHLPLGFQIMGKKYSENLLFELGEKFELTTGYKPNTVSF